MKSLLLSLTMAVALAISCTENRESKDQSVPLRFDKTVGQQIPLDVAERWRMRSGGSAGREVSPHSIKAETLSQALSPVADKVGVVFQHALDDDGVYHVILIPLVEGAELSEANVFVDTNTDSPIQKSTAVHWADNYKAHHANEVLYHFFGIGIFNEILENQSLNYVEIEPALNDDEEFQLLLYVWNNRVPTNGRTTEEDSPTVYDFSNRCPPCANVN